MFIITIHQQQAEHIVEILIELFWSKLMVRFSFISFYRWLATLSTTLPMLVSIIKFLHNWELKICWGSFRNLFNKKLAAKNVILGHFLSRQLNLRIQKLTNWDSFMYEHLFFLTVAHEYLEGRFLSKPTVA